MITNVKKINRIAEFICKNGKLVHRASSCWGATKWQFGLLSTTREDDGYTTCIYSQNLGLSISHTYGEVSVREGKIEDLDILYDNLFGEDE